MAQRDRNNNPPTRRSEQYVQNYSFDETFQIMVAGMLAYNASNTSLEYLEKDNNGNLKVNATLTGSTAFSDSGGTEKQGLVDAARHVQTDVVGELPAGTNTIGNVGKKLGTSSTRTSVAGSATVVTLKASNTNRIKLVIFNDSIADLHIAEGSAATTTDFTYKLLGGETVIIDDYSGIVTGIWSAATGNARVTETT